LQPAADFQSACWGADELLLATIGHQQFRNRSTTLFTTKIGLQIIYTRIEPVKDFFISYTSADGSWADWIAWTLQDAG
jgi:hypothetical protein